MAIYPSAMAMSRITSEISWPMGGWARAAPAAFMAAPEPDEPSEQRKDQPDRCTDKKLIRQNGREPRGDEGDAREHSHNNTEQSAQHPVGKKSSEQNDGRCAAP